jgi:hypothetical protein
MKIFQVFIVLACLLVLMRQLSLSELPYIQACHLLVVSLVTHLPACLNWQSISIVVHAQLQGSQLLVVLTCRPELVK